MSLTGEINGFLRKKKKKKNQDPLASWGAMRKRHAIQYRNKPNFMTPHVISKSRAGNYLIELSEGSGFNHERLYGVSVFRYISHLGQFKSSNRTYSLSKSFSNLNEAKAYIAKLKKKLGGRR